jgi:hypothetical protein
MVSSLVKICRIAGVNRQNEFAAKLIKKYVPENFCQLYGRTLCSG